MKTQTTINKYDTIIDLTLNNSQGSFKVGKKTVPYNYNSLEISARQRTDETFSTKIVLNTVTKEDLLNLADKLTQLANSIEIKELGEPVLA
jgi:hypothetical protein